VSFKDTSLALATWGIFFGLFNLLRLVIKHRLAQKGPIVNVMKLFFFVSDGGMKLARVFNGGKCFQAGLMGMFQRVKSKVVTRYWWLILLSKI